MVRTPAVTALLTLAAALFAADVTHAAPAPKLDPAAEPIADRKSTRLNSSH